MPSLCQAARRERLNENMPKPNAVGQNTQATREFGRYRFDLRAGALSRSGRSIELNPKCAATLAYLIEQAGSVVTKDELLASVWPEGSVEPNNVPQTIYVLRRTFKIAGDDDEFIATIPGRGYRFEPSVHAPSGVMSTPRSSAAWLRLGVAVIVAVTCAAVFAAVRSGRHAAAPSISEEARVAYEQGRFYWSRRSMPNLTIALRHFESAIAVEPKFAQAFSGLSDTYSMMMMESASPSDFKRYGALAKDAAEHSVALDNRCSECHASVALVNEDGNHRKTVEDEFRTAIRLNPTYATAHEWYSWQLFRWNERKDALSEMHRAAQLDPTSPIINLALGWQLFYDREFDAALAAFTDTSTLDPASDWSFFGIALAQEQNGHADDALKAVNRAIALNPDPEYIAERGRLLAKVHRWREAEASLTRLLAQRPRPFYYLALIYDALDQRQLAELYLVLAKKRHDVAMKFVPYDPRIDDLRMTVN